MRTILSECRTYRYSLWREWLFGSGYAVFIGLNPSTADETKDDPTIRRCCGYAKAWGYSAVCMLNLFAFRATRPDDMKAADDPIGPENNRYLRELTAGAGVVIAAWGVDGQFMDRDTEVKQMIFPLHCLRLTKGGHPGHPLYLPKHLVPVEFECRDQCGQNP